MNEKLKELVDEAKEVVEHQMSFYSNEAKAAAIAAVINYMAAERLGSAIIRSNWKSGSGGGGSGAAVLW